MATKEETDRAAWILRAAGWKWLDIARAIGAKGDGSAYNAAKRHAKRVGAPIQKGVGFHSEVDGVLQEVGAKACPQCSRVMHIPTHFGYRRGLHERHKPQSWCKECRQGYRTPDPERRQHRAVAQAAPRLVVTDESQRHDGGVIRAPDPIAVALEHARGELEASSKRAEQATQDMRAAADVVEALMLAASYSKKIQGE